jgi:hypothetical protein
MGKYFRRENLDYHAVAASASASVLVPFNVIVTSHGDALGYKDFLAPPTTIMNTSLAIVDVLPVELASWVAPNRLFFRDE